MTEELLPADTGHEPFGSSSIELEDGELLEDGEIADDDDANVGDDNDDKVNNNNNNTIIRTGGSLLGTHPDATTAGSNGKAINGKENIRRVIEDSRYNNREEDSFKSKRARVQGHRGQSKRKRSNSPMAGGGPGKVKSSKFIGNKVALNGTSSNGTLDILDITQWLYDDSFDKESMPDQADFNLDSLDFHTLMETLGCSAPAFNFGEIRTGEDRYRIMLRIVKIMRHITDQNDALRARRFARLKRHSNKVASNSPPPSSMPSTLLPTPVTGGTPFTINKPFRKQKCKFYLEGKCHKGDGCTFSHDVSVPKRKDLCKFYLQGFCGKGDACNFMHGEFPCKFFHTNVECYSKEKCRFSHAPLNEETKELLRNYLDSGTLPDDPKPFRPAKPQAQAASALSPNGSANFGNQLAGESLSPTNDSEDADYDRRFNSETEEILARPRKSILGEIPKKLRNSSETWRWQQSLKDLEQDYKGGKKNLYQIDEPLVISKEPNIEDSEEEVEAMIREYYKDTIENSDADYDEMWMVREIEEHQKVNKDVPAPVFPMINNVDQIQQQPPMVYEEEEKRLIEASAHDEDLRFSKPGVMPGGPFGSGPFGDIGNVSEEGLTTNDVDSFLKQLRNNSSNVQAEEPSELAAPGGYRDPRLKRIKQTNFPGPASTQQQLPQLPPLFVDSSIPEKPYMKTCNPNVHIEYRMMPINGSVVDYSSCYEAYQAEGKDGERNPLKADPRLIKFFAFFPVPDVDLRGKTTAKVDPVAAPPITISYSLASFSKKVGAGSSPSGSTFGISSMPSPAVVATSAVVAIPAPAVCRDPRRDPRMKPKLEPPTPCTIATSDAAEKVSIDSMDSVTEAITSPPSDQTSSTIETSSTTVTPAVVPLTITTPQEPTVAEIPSYAMAAQPSIFAISSTTSSISGDAMNSPKQSPECLEAVEAKPISIVSDTKEPSNWTELNTVDSDDEADKMQIDLEHANDSDDDDQLLIASETDEIEKDSSDTLSNESFSIGS